MFEYNLEKTKGAIKNGQSRETGDIGRRQTIQKHNTENQKDKRHGSHQKQQLNLGAREWQAVYFSCQYL